MNLALLSFPTKMTISDCHSLLLFLLALLVCTFPPKYASPTDEKITLLEFKNRLKDPANYLRSWVNSTSPCEFFGVSCDAETAIVTAIVLQNLSLEGEISPSLSQLQGLTSLVLTSNSIYGIIPPELSHCKNLKHLNLSNNNMVRKIPDLSELRNLKVLDLSSNLFSGEFPPWVSNLTGLVSLGMGNISFTEGGIPESLGNLKNLTWLFLRKCNRVGPIPESIYGLKELTTIDLSRNGISGILSKSVSKLTKITKIELFGNNLTGEVPIELANLTLLQEFDISANYFYGNLPIEFGNLKNLTVFELYENHFTGKLPPGFQDLRHLEGFSIYRNSFSGEFPANFGRFSPLVSLDISENNFTGPFPSFLCANQSLQMLLALDNDFSGSFPPLYANCKSLVRFRVGQNRLSGELPDGIWTMPNIKIMDLSDNDFIGAISKEIWNSASMSQLILENNRFSGALPSELGKLTNLERLYLSNNSFSGDIPPQIGLLKQLSSLQLEENSLSGSIPSELGQCTNLADLNLAGNLLGFNIPDSLSQMTSLNSLNLSSNRLVGEIPESLGKLKLSLIDLSKNQLSGSVPVGIFQIGGESAFLGNKGLCVKNNMKLYKIRLCNDKQIYNKREISNKLMVSCIILSVIVVILALLMLMNYRNYKVSVSFPEDGTNDKVHNFRHLEFDVNEICSIEEENLVGNGSTGNVYRLELKRNGRRTVAVKRLWKGTGFKVMSTEMGILGKIRHRNILKLYASVFKDDTGFLVFEYMRNGSLFQALFREKNGEGELKLDWNKRYIIALGVAKGLAYLHHDCSPPIIHRDIKSSNILLDDNYEPKIADFGVAKTTDISTQGSSEFGCFAGTHGYIAPEMAYACKITEKSDVYSYGVVLLELLTSRNPVEVQYGEGNDIVKWVRSRVNDKKCKNNYFDNRIAVSMCVNNDMMKVLKIAILCTADVPSFRPIMRDVVKLLVDANPCTTMLVVDHSD